MVAFQGSHSDDGSKPVDGIDHFDNELLPNKRDEMSMGVGPIRVYPGCYQAEIHGNRIDLWPSELTLLVLLMQYRGRIVSRRSILTHTVGHVDAAGLRTVDRRVSRLRAKLGPAAAWIRTVRAGGYVLCPPDEPTPRRLLSVIGLLLYAAMDRSSLWLTARHRTTWFAGLAAGVVAVVIGLAYVVPMIVRHHALRGPHQALSYLGSVTTPGPRTDGFGTFGDAMASLGQPNRFVTLIQPMALNKRPARLRTFDLYSPAEPYGPEDATYLVVRATDRLRDHSHPVADAASWSLGRGQAFRIGPGGTLLVVDHEGTRIIEFDNTGRWLRDHPLRSDGWASQAGGVEALAVARDQIAIVASRLPGGASFGSAVPVVALDLETGQTVAGRYSLDDPAGELRDMTAIDERWLLVAESIGPASDPSSRVYLIERDAVLRAAPSHASPAPPSAVDKRLVLDTSALDADIARKLNRLPLLSMALDTPSADGARRLVLVASGPAEPTFLVVFRVDMRSLLPSNALIGEPPASMDR